MKSNSLFTVTFTVLYLAYMLSWEEHLQDYSSKYSTLIRKATKPLRDRLGVCGFAYHLIDSQGKYALLGDRPDWLEQYIQAKLYVEDPYLRHPDVYRSGLCLVEHNGTDAFKEKMNNFRDKTLNMDIDVVLIQKSKDYVEFFRFESSHKLGSLQKAYLNHPELLKSFAPYFKQQLSKIITKMHHESNTLLNLHGDNFYCREIISPELELDTREAFLKDIDNTIPYLTKREKDCIRLLLEGKTAKETASILTLSQRTVEFYFENIKDKLGCYYKHEILNIARRLKEFGLL